MKKGRKKSKKPYHCNGCVHHWSKGIKDGRHNNWCCKFGNPAPSSVSHCKLFNGKNLTNS